MLFKEVLNYPLILIVLIMVSFEFNDLFNAPILIGCSYFGYYSAMHDGP
jgi:hypothetical protein